ncbi:murein hydrolase activator EnvC family protein [Nocardioides jiangxiensis]|uniref:M23 family metallopeptidase n=1 Tax=Nocardioides jiangxiensis TaxID=3064524 RepID=A0ABT9B4F8_9ACTN|nr:M23 family metallopeptidase [Nocardioides sp. WY-20]MDO7869204.1 M23 family metallopeptidase [Nocardioides sp. WY-20]
MYLIIPALLSTLYALPTTTPPHAALTATAPGPAPTATEHLDPRGRGVWPVGTSPVVVHGFAPPPMPWAAGHRGVDLDAAAGDTVRAALAGQVVFTGRIAGRGVVVVSHGATRTTYEPVTALVHVGDRVGTGAPIGVLQAGGHCAPGTCLHWGWLRGETYLDPLELVGAAGPVRLKPWQGLSGAA